MANKDWRNESDDEMFPVCNEDREHDLYTDEYGVTYACELIEGLGWGWKAVWRKDGKPLGE